MYNVLTKCWLCNIIFLKNALAVANLIGDILKSKFSVYGMTCSACSSAVERSVNKLNGIKSAVVNLASNTLVVEFDEGLTSEKQIMSAVVKAGYKVALYGDKQGVQQNNMGKRVLISLPFAVAIFYISMGAMLALPQPKFLLGGQNALTLAIVQAVLFLPVCIVNYKYFTSGFKKLFTLVPNMDSLIATGALACIIYSIVTTVRITSANAIGDFEACAHLTHYLQYEGASMILTLVTVGKYFEAKTKVKTGDALNKLKALSPSDALVLRDGKEVRLPISQIEIGDILIVKEGDSVACDGNVQSGEGAVNQSAITGESIPVYKKQGDSLFSGSILQSGYLEVKVSATSENSCIAKIISMVEEAGASKAPISSLADKIARIFVPCVIAIAIVTFFVHYLISKDFSLAFNYGVSVLVVSCPCALGLATPLAVMLASGKGVEHGVLIRSGEALQKLASIEIIGFDKTGTLTKGKPTVVDIALFEDESKVLTVLYALENKSNHPLANAICEYCKELGVLKVEAETVKNLHGRGVCGRLNGEFYQVVNYATCEGMVSKEQLAIYQKYANVGATPVFLTSESRVMAIIAIKDVVREGTPVAISQMRANGLTPVMITGDNNLTAMAVASELNMDYVSDVFPDGKRYAVMGLKKSGKVAFVGDGINDAPALAEADVGIAVGGGTDIAIDNAEVILLKNDMRDAVYAVMLGKRCLKTIKQNLFWAFFYNCLGIPLAAGVFEAICGLSLTPSIASAMMSLSSLFVVGNSLRMRYFNSVKVDKKGDAEHSARKLLKEDLNLKEIALKNEEQLLLEQSLTEQENKENLVMKKYLYISGMMCAHCQARVQKILGKTAGVKSCVVELENNRALVEFDQTFDVQALALALSEDGYELIREEIID